MTDKIRCSRIEEILAANGRPILGTRNPIIGLALSGGKAGRENTEQTKDDETNEKFGTFLFVVIFRLFRILSSTSITCLPNLKSQISDQLFLHLAGSHAI
jgi:hypothetical protein